MRPPPTDEPAALHTYRRLLVVTGAGVSAPSGLATYRSAGSSWDNPDFERMSHASRYGNHLAQLWPYWSALRTAAAAARPNAAHYALAGAQERLAAAGGWLHLVTQNVDGLHTAAGARQVAELHGSLSRSRCLRRSCPGPYRDEQVSGSAAHPTCPACGRLSRPDVVLFGERPNRALFAAAAHAARQADLCLFVGTSGLVHPAASLAELASAAGAYCVLVNESPWQDGGDVFDQVLLGDAAAVLPGLLHLPAARS